MSPWHEVVRLRDDLKSGELPLAVFAADLFKPPRSRVAALCFDKIDIETGVATPGPNGDVRRLRYPWSVLAGSSQGRMDCD